MKPPLPEAAGSKNMPLQTNNKPTAPDAEGFNVAFGMLDGAGEVGCRISLESLQDAFGADGNMGSMISAFNSNRHRIEAVASRKYDQGQISNRLVRLTTADF
uniref:DUF1488 domain-containing protein n=1 Tax=Methylobacterium sp. B34 TaxID=95563 RepID=UPI000FE14852|nr:DUF1488 domain-containing protein [Methylobacterium sp. B34]